MSVMIFLNFYEVRIPRNENTVLSHKCMRTTDKHRSTIIFKLKVKYLQSQSSTVEVTKPTNADKYIPLYLHDIM